jgi:ubiquinone/menaquinone biosynthesis C-methylase UbiE
MRPVPMSAFDAAAPSFARDRALPDGVAAAVRATILAAAGADAPRILDLGAGSGRIGRACVAAGDDYVGIDASLGMLRAFMRDAHADHAPPLAQADGRALPFRDETFDAVLLIQVFGGMRDWRQVLAEARRVLRSAGALVVGRAAAPSDGLDAQMRQRLAALLGEMAVAHDATNFRDDAQAWLASRAAHHSRIVAATWEAERTARAFIARHRTGARFATLPNDVKDAALAQLAAWAVEAFGSLDAVAPERHAFELDIYRFGHATHL